ncbi:hypothetical protein [Claveliimonas bilis]|uniref:Uncharacterized protein n=1 Tax=Claveliimonas bilis TaxID=3028070 RepID=A0ABM8I0K4_9FIRM|nr:hypothetical protein [Claveliimonas bilis]BDZ76099.1 hypothetical protein Lac1_02820 [Claveliimonas bilis]
MRKGTSLLKIVLFLGLVLAIIQKITGSSAFTSSVLEIFQAIIVTAMPAVIMIAGIYILIRCLFR